MDTRANAFNVLADEQKIQRKAAKKAQLDEDRLKRKQQRETEEKAQLANANWADVSDSSDDESSKSISVSSEESSDIEQNVEIQITFGTKKQPEKQEVKKADDEDDFLNALAADAPATAKPTAPVNTKPKAKGGKKTATKVDISEDPDVIAAKAAVAKAEEDVKKAKGSEKQAKKGLLQKAQNALKDVERRAMFKANRAN